MKKCIKCNVNQIKRHKFYESLQLISSLSISFYTFTIDFILTFLELHIDMNIIMNIICKFNKRIIAIFEKNTWKIFDWDIAMFDRFDIANWNFFKIFISNQNRKFLTHLWFTLFNKLDVKLFYSTVYHSETNEVSKQTN